MVAFLARRKDSFQGSQMGYVDIPFDIVDLNLGNAYNPDTGEFIAPVAGIYELSYEVFPDYESCKNNGYIDATLNINYISSISFSTVRYLTSGGMPLTLQFEVGDRVVIDFIGYDGCIRIAAGAVNNKFSGHLVYKIT